METKTERVQRVTTYIESISKLELLSLGLEVGLLLDRIWGIHHLEWDYIKKANWDDDHHIIIEYAGNLATIDGNELTKLVVLGHLSMLRVAIHSKSKRTVNLLFHKRTHRNRSRTPYVPLSAYYPTLEQHIKNLNYGPEIEELFSLPDDEETVIKQKNINIGYDDYGMADLVDVLCPGCGNTLYALDFEYSNAGDTSMFSFWCCTCEENDRECNFVLPAALDIEIKYNVKNLRGFTRG